MNIQKYLDLFENKTRGNGDKFWCFTDKTFVNDSEEEKLRLKIGEVIRDSSLDQDNAYLFTVEALGAIQEIQANLEKGDTLNESLNEPRNIEPYAEAPIYNSELIEWVSNCSNYSFIDEVVDEMGNDVIENGIIPLIMIAYSKAWEENYYKVLAVVN